MPRVGIKASLYKSRKQAAAAKAIAKARATILSSRRSSFRVSRYNARPSELKTIDSGAATITAVGAGAAGSVVLLSGVATGTDFTNRVGRKILMNKFLFRASAYPISTTTSPIGDVLRLMLVYDTQSNGALPAIADVLQAASYQSPMNLNNRDRFKVLWDQFCSIGANTYAAGALTAGSPEPKHMDFFQNGRWEEIFSGTTNAVTDITSGTIFLLAITQSGTVRLEYNSRIRFNDQ